jgi:hypothetical protein
MEMRTYYIEETVQIKTDRLLAYQVYTPKQSESIILSGSDIFARLHPANARQPGT